MRYDRFVHIIRRDDKIKAVLTSASAGRQALKDMRDNAMPSYKPSADLEEYMRLCMIEEQKWHLEKWAVCKTMST
jgi:hypothetical protein